MKFSLVQFILLITILVFAVATFRYLFFSFGRVQGTQYFVMLALAFTCCFLASRKEFLLATLAVLAIVLSSFSNISAKSDTATALMGLANRIPSYKGNAEEISIFLKNLKFKDAWFNPLEVNVDSEGNLLIKSLGRDNLLGGEGEDEDMYILVDLGGRLIERNISVSKKR